MTNPSKYLVIYHGNCWDGAAAAYCTQKYIVSLAPTPADVEVQLEPWAYADDRDVLEFVTALNASDLTIYIVDFSFSRDITAALCKLNGVSAVYVLDHHKTAKAHLQDWDDAPNNLHVTFDMTRSGAKICYDRSPILYSTGVTTLVNFIQDRDLWTWKLPQTKAVMAYMDALERTPENFAQASTDFGKVDGLLMYVMAGTAILEYQARVIAEHVKHIKFHTVHGYKFATVNATTLPSEIGQAILEAYPEVQVAHMYNQREDLKMVVNSLRSRPESAGGVDVSHIAKVFGGGGHYSAAGYETGLYP